MQRPVLTRSLPRFDQLRVFASSDIATVRGKKSTWPIDIATVRGQNSHKTSSKMAQKKIGDFFATPSPKRPAAARQEEEEVEDSGGKKSKMPP